jgi:hypothetical protein
MVSSRGPRCGLRSATCLISLSTAAVLGAWTHAHAQFASAQYASGQFIDSSTEFNPNNIEASEYDRGENVSVTQRARTDYQALGVHLGAFMVYPKINLGFLYDDNIFATHTGALGDEIFTIAPEIDFQSTWSRNGLAGYVRDSQSVFVKHSTEDTNQYGAGLDGKFEFGDSVLNAAVDYARYALPRSVANTGSEISKHPIEYDYVDEETVLQHTFNRLRLSARFDFQNYDYLNGETVDGLEAPETYLNHNNETYTGKAEYALSPKTALYVAGAYNVRNYGEQPGTVPYNSSSNGYNIAGGATFDLTHLIRGDIQLGYLDQTYQSPLFKTIQGLSAKGQIEWFPTQLTTVTLTGLRAVGDSEIIGAAGYINSTGALQVDHELLRNLILTANASTTQNQYSGIDRNDHIWTVGAYAKWYLASRIQVTFGYTHADQTSSGTNAGPSFTDNRVTLSNTLQF